MSGSDSLPWTNEFLRSRNLGRKKTWCFKHVSNISQFESLGTVTRSVLLDVNRLLNVLYDRVRGKDKQVENACICLFCFTNFPQFHFTNIGSYNPVKLSLSC